MNMELPAKQSLIERRRQPNREEVFKLLEEFETSDKLTAKSFCDQHQMTSSRFYYWLKRYRTQHVDSSASKGFVPLVVKTKSFPSAPVSGSLFAEVNGIRLYQVVPPEYLKVLAS
jgi:hypothetical protein